MNFNKFDKPDEIEELDGTLINVDMDKEILTANKNYYFFGAAVVAIGSVIIGVGAYTYFNVETNRDSAYVLWGLGGLLFLGGFIAVLKAAMYLLCLKPFLKNAKFTRCNVEWRKETSSVGSRNKKWSNDNYILQVEYLDDKGKRRKKIIKWGIAHNFYGKVLRFNTRRRYSIHNYPTLVAYNSKGKIVLLYKYDIVGDL